jgi:integrase
LDELPNNEWKLLFALSRRGGLHVGSEVRQLKWHDIDFERQRILVHSPKTERYEGRETRLIPLFPELAELLSKRFDEAFETNGYREPDGNSPVLPMLKGKTDAALRDPLERAIERAGLKQWPRL